MYHKSRKLIFHAGWSSSVRIAWRRISVPCGTRAPGFMPESFYIYRGKRQWNKLKNKKMLMIPYRKKRKRKNIQIKSFPSWLRRVWEKKIQSVAIRTQSAWKHWRELWFFRYIPSQFPNLTASMLILYIAPLARNMGHIFPSNCDLPLRNGPIFTG